MPSTRGKRLSSQQSRLKAPQKGSKCWERLVATESHRWAVKIILITYWTTLNGIITTVSFCSSSSSGHSGFEACGSLSRCCEWSFFRFDSVTAPSHVRWPSAQVRLQMHRRRGVIILKVTP
ncbi:uncharacterized protein BDZ99DRAFT_200273 [Mytilinidion resinicola]|uniref:Uncharacterized protein n=1 Tax=Mytilinidion resinicola TaxID=574789 RepID=A0A6A6Y2F0_9PEZI|nr:uncharacterized protein BDZ99DRAFT_200273 [Mytilinidion resinicola]KAF2802819.1 hypothetical protein BDZ99DRAFT_200273 [Mytilinidion resinicola]